MATSLPVAAMRLFRVIPIVGSYSIRKIAWFYNQKYPASSKPRQAINWLTRVPLARYRVEILIKEKLLERLTLVNGKRKTYKYELTDKGRHWRQGHDV